MEEFSAVKGLESGGDCLKKERNSGIQRVASWCYLYKAREGVTGKVIRSSRVTLSNFILPRRHHHQRQRRRCQLKSSADQILQQTILIYQKNLMPSPSSWTSTSSRIKRLKTSRTSDLQRITSPLVLLLFIVILYYI